jgi:hypothetical protein
MVGKTGFEPATPWSQTKCSTKLSYFPSYGAPERSRTPNLLIRSQTLYPIELRAHGAENRNRTGTVVTYRRILSPVRLPVPPPRHLLRAEDGIRTRDPHLGKVVFYH